MHACTYAYMHACLHANVCNLWQSVQTKKVYRVPCKTTRLHLFCHTVKEMNSQWSVGCWLWHHYMALYGNNTKLNIKLYGRISHLWHPLTKTVSLETCSRGWGWGGVVPALECLHRLKLHLQQSWLKPETALFLSLLCCSIAPVYEDCMCVLLMPLVSCYYRPITPWLSETSATDKTAFTGCLCKHGLTAVSDWVALEQCFGGRLHCTIQGWDLRIHSHSAVTTCWQTLHQIVGTQCWSLTTQPAYKT